MARKPARREWASGSIYRHGDRWRVAISLGSDAFGKRVRKEWQVRSQAAAERKLREVHVRLRGGLPAEESKITVSAYAQEWLAGVQHSVRPSTFAFYRTLAEVHLDELGHLPLAKVGPADIRGLIAARLAEGYAPRTVRGIVDVLRMILKQAVGDGILTRNVAELVQRPKLEQSEPKHFTADQARRFLEVVKDDELGSFFAVALGTGLRRSELLALTWQDVEGIGDVAGRSRDEADVGGGRRRHPSAGKAADRLPLAAGLAQRVPLRGRRAGEDVVYTVPGPVLRVRKGKTAAAARVIPLPAFAEEALAQEEKRPGPIWPVSPWVVSRRMTQLCEKARLPKLGLHGLRHTAASLMLDSGVDPLTIQAILGHTRVSMTAHYARAGEALRRDAVERLGRVVG